MRRQTLIEVIAICIATIGGLLITAFLKANYLQEYSLQDTIDLALLNMLTIASFFMLLEEVWTKFYLKRKIKEMYFSLIENEAKLRAAEKRKQEAYKKYGGIELEVSIRTCEMEIQMIGVIVDSDIRCLEKYSQGYLSDRERQKITEIKRRRELGSV